MMNFILSVVGSAPSLANYLITYITKYNHYLQDYNRYLYKILLLKFENKYFQYYWYYRWASSYQTARPGLGYLCTPYSTSKTVYKRKTNFDDCIIKSGPLLPGNSHYICSIEDWTCSRTIIFNSFLTPQNECCERFVYRPALFNIILSYY